MLRFYLLALCEFSADRVNVEEDGIVGFIFLIAGCRSVRGDGWGFGWIRGVGSGFVSFPVFLFLFFAAEEAEEFFLRGLLFLQFARFFEFVDEFALARGVIFGVL